MYLLCYFVTLWPYIRRVESAHNTLKQHLRSATGGFDTVFEHIDRMLDDQILHVESSLEYSRNNAPTELKNEPMFAVIDPRVSLMCLEHLYEILTEARSGNYTEECNDGRWRTTLDLPCVHEVARIIQENRVFYPQDVHLFWRQSEVGRTFARRCSCRIFHT